MRKIKFRAWDKEYFKFHRIESIEFLDGEVENVIIQNYMPIHISKIELMQYTGLHDKNGVEIYEGDVIKGKRHNFEDYEICVIVYRPISFVFEVQSEKGNYIAPRNWHQHFEVIGNIYENPELLS